MKKYIIFYVLFLIFFSCKNEEKSYATFSGKIKNTKEPIIKVVDYNHSYDKDITIDSSGKFSDTISVLKPGTYFFQVGRNYYTFLLKNGYDLNLTINSDDFYNSIRFTGKGSDVNNFNISRLKTKSELIGNSKDFFLVSLDTFLLNIKHNKTIFTDLLQKSKLNEVDKTIQKKIIDYDYLLTKNNYDKFVYYHNKKHPELPDTYYDEILNINIDDESAYCYSKDYRTLLSESWRLNFVKKKELDSELNIIDFTKDFTKGIKSTIIKDRIVSLLFRLINNKNQELDKNFAEIIKMLSSEILKEKATNKYNSLKSTVANNKTIGFKYENYKGGFTSLDDLKGKLVYIDIWATWCGPCKKEIPYLEKIIKKYENKEIEFVSISVDSPNDYEKWKKMIAEKNLNGIQLFADNSFKSDFIKFYNVNLIPRYILIDKNGRIITSKAPRPSAENTIHYLDSLLTRNTKKL